MQKSAWHKMIPVGKKKILKSLIFQVVYSHRCCIRFDTTSMAVKISVFYVV